MVHVKHVRKNQIQETRLFLRHAKFPQPGRGNRNPTLPYYFPCRLGIQPKVFGFVLKIFEI